MRGLSFEETSQRGAGAIGDKIDRATAKFSIALFQIDPRESEIPAPAHPHPQLITVSIPVTKTGQLSSQKLLQCQYFGPHS